MRKTITIISALILAATGFAQEQKTPEQIEKEFREGLDQQVETMAESLGLNDAQIFWADSILTANMYGMKDELQAMRKARVENTDLYMIAQDKWMEKTYEAFRKILSPEQWSKYLKSGAERDKKARDKRAQKRK